MAILYRLSSPTFQVIRCYGRQDNGAIYGALHGIMAVLLYFDSHSSDLERASTLHTPLGIKFPGNMVLYFLWQGRDIYGVTLNFEQICKMVGNLVIQLLSTLHLKMTCNLASKDFQRQGNFFPLNKTSQQHFHG